MKKTILVLEDDPLIALDLAETLQELGYNVLGPVSSGPAALTLLQQHNAHLALLDIQVAGPWDGIQTAAEIQKLKPLPFVFLTSFGEEVLVKKALETKPAAYLLKPFSDKQLAITLTIAMNAPAAVPEPATDAAPTAEPATADDAADQKLMLVADRQLLLIVQGQYVKLNMAELLYMEAKGNYTDVYTATKTYTLTTGIGKLEQVCDQAGLLRVHRSFIINPMNITSFTEEFAAVGQKLVPMGKNGFQLVMNALRSSGR